MQYEFSLKLIKKMKMNRNTFFLIYTIENKSVFINPLHIYVHAVE